MPPPPPNGTRHDPPALPPSVMPQADAGRTGSAPAPAEPARQTLAPARPQEAPVTAAAPPPPPSPPTRWVALPLTDDCYGYNRLCRALEAIDLVNEIRAIWIGEDAVEHFNDWVEERSGRRPAIINLPPAETQLPERLEAIRMIYELEISALNLVANTLREAVRDLRPFDWEKERLRAFNTWRIQAEAQIGRMHMDAAAEVDKQTHVWRRDRSSTSIRLTPGPAFRQLVNASMTGVGIPRNF